MTNLVSDKALNVDATALGVADVRISGGGITAYSALLAALNLDYSQASQDNANFNYQAGGKLKPVGIGNGFDLGLTAQIGKIGRPHHRLWRDDLDQQPAHPQ